MALSMVSCSQPGGAPTTSAPAPSSTSPGATTTAPKTVIDFWLAPLEEAPTAWWNKYVDLYNQTNTDNVTINLQYVPTDAWDAKLKAAQATGTAPQLAYVNHASAIKGAPQGLYLPLNDYLDMAKLGDLYPNVKDMITVGGKVYSIPMYTEPYQVLFYRKDLFTAAGLDPNAPPKTWTDLLTDAKALTKGDTFGLAIAGSGDQGWVNWAWEAAIGLNMISDDWSKSTVVNQTSKDYLAFTKSLYDAGVVPPQALSAYWDIQPLVDGRVAMQFNGSWAISRIMVDFKDTIDPNVIGIALPPTPNGIKPGDPVGALGGYGLAIDGKAKDPQLVANFIAWLLLGDPSYLAEFMSANYFSKFSVRQSVDAALQSVTTNKVTDWFNLISQQVTPYSKPEPIYPWDVDVAFSNAMDNVVVNGMSVDDALAQADKDINDYIANNNVAGANPRAPK